MEPVKPDEPFPPREKGQCELWSVLVAQEDTWHKGQGLNDREARLWTRSSSLPSIQLHYPCLSLMMKGATINPSASPWLQRDVLCLPGHLLPHSSTAGRSLNLYLIIRVPSKSCRWRGVCSQPGLSWSNSRRNPSTCWQAEVREGRAPCVQKEVAMWPLQHHSLPVGTFWWQDDMRWGAVIGLDAVKERYSLFQCEEQHYFLGWFCFSSDLLVLNSVFHRNVEVIAPCKDFDVACWRILDVVLLQFWFNGTARQQ